MSRRATFVLLAATAALIATQAAADPECFGDTCHLPEVVESPAAAVSIADPSASTEANAAAPTLAPAKALPQVMAEPAVEPMVRRRLQPQPSVAAEIPSEPVRPVPRTAAKLAPIPVTEPEAAPASYARPTRVSSSESAYVVSQAAYPIGAIAVVVPGAVYGAGRPAALMIAPSAKIISIDTND